jgi:hypothetical protein
VGIKTKAIIEVQCDLCCEHKTVEADRNGPRLDGLGYRKLKLTIEPIDPELCEGLAWTSAPQVVCRDCLAKIKESLHVKSGEDQCEAELERMKKALKEGRR